MAFDVKATYTNKRSSIHDPHTTVHVGCATMEEAMITIMAIASSEEAHPIGDPVGIGNDRVRVVYAKENNKDIIEFMVSPITR